MRGDAIQVTELSQMRAAMHPARWRVLTELFDRQDGMTATQAAELTGLTPSAMSYHLNVLARAGFIERDDSDDGRERPWRATGGGLEITGMPDEAMGRALMQNLLAEVTRLFAAGPPRGPDGTPWPASFTHTQVHLTKERAKELHRRVQEVIAEFEDDEDGPEYELFWIQGVGPGR
ncbi:ArsR/SmtB family transcription factor [Microbacterium luticocti]|uniref:ArsR/SmtB family transcription factor n=1 Tax=Microbacterium luticocti TaxID=451764 RepID=UPI0004030622|nr:winged helix-turn-helix domain-containing protein [Microbacterium luticocti]